MTEQNVIRLQLDHRSIRVFTEQRVDEAQLQTLQEVFCHTASSTGLQQASVICVEDPEKKKKIAEWGGQDYIAKAPHLWVYVVGTFRSGEINREKGGRAEDAWTMDQFFQGFSDALLGAQNVNLAVEALGLGGCFIGNILNRPDQIISLLELPKGTFPALAYMFGHPAQDPQKKPRMPVSMRFFTDRYERPASYVDALSAYDETMKTYYDLRQADRPVAKFTDQVVSRLANASPIRKRILETVAAQGFTPISGASHEE